MRSAQLASFLDFENEPFLLSRGVDHRVRICLLTVVGREEQVRETSFAFGTRYMEDLPGRRFAMPPEEILLVNANTGTLPVFRSRQDAEITLKVYHRVPVLLRERSPDGNPWGLTPRQELCNMATDSDLFRTQEQLTADGWTLNGNVFERNGERYLPLYEAKMLHHFDHRLGTYEGQTEAQANMGTLPRVTPEQHDDPGFAPMPRYWVPQFDVDTGEKGRKGKPVLEHGVASRSAERGWNRGWLMEWRDIARSTDTRTVIGAALPAYGVGHKFPLLFVQSQAAALQAVLTSFACDYVARQKVVGTSMTYGYVMQFPVPEPVAARPFPGSELESYADWCTPRVLELTYASTGMASFAADHGCGGTPYRWDGERRELLRAELDTACVHLYGVDCDEVDYVMETFPTVKRKDEAAHGTCRAKNLILDNYDRMTEAQ
ncbi:hypothetical protein ACWEMW_18215 [Streptomyces sp. NPDC004684]